MRIALRCGKCRDTWMQGEEDLCLEIDFYDKKIFFVCPRCKHENRMDIADWQKKQESSALPRISIC